jgi:hypothetical protein
VLYKILICYHFSWDISENIASWLWSSTSLPCRRIALRLHQPRLREAVVGPWNSSSLVQPQLQQMSRRTFHACSSVTNSCRVSKKTQPDRLDDLPGMRNQKKMKVITFFKRITHQGSWQGASHDGTAACSNLIVYVYVVVPEVETKYYRDPRCMYVSPLMH